MDVTAGVVLYLFSSGTLEVGAVKVPVPFFLIRHPDGDVIVDYADHIDKIVKNRPEAEALAGYYRNFLLTISLQVAPFAILLSTLIALGILSKNNEDTAFRASGVSLHRLGAALVRTSLAEHGRFGLRHRLLSVGAVIAAANHDPGVLHPNWAVS